MKSATTDNKEALFRHLHVHSEYSLSDGAIRISELVSRVKEYGHDAVALTDHGNMFGAIEFYSACVGAGIKPILGSEIYHRFSPDAQKAFSNEEHFDPSEVAQLVLLAKNNDGYQSVIKVVSYGYLFGYKDIPVVSFEHLEQQSHELIALSSGHRGEFAKLVHLLTSKCADAISEFQNPQSDETKQIVSAIRSHVRVMQQIFGAEHYFIEIIDNNLQAQKSLNPVLIELAKLLDLPLVASCNAHYLNPDFAKAHAVLVGIRNDLTMSKMRYRRKDVVFHLLDNAEMQSRFRHLPEALANSIKIADQCNVTIEFGKFFLPDFDLEGEDINDALVRLSKEGLEDRLKVLRPQYGPSFDAEAEKGYWQRLDHELKVILNMGFPGYFLIVQDFINWAKQNDIPVGPGRGSGAGSIVAYALKITDLDPIPLNLIFERFLNPERISMPDFDVDFCQSRRDEVIQYVNKKYTPQNVAQITTFGKLKAKAAIRDVGRVLELSYSRVDKIAKLIPNELDIKLKDALAQEPRLLEEADQDPMVKEILEVALSLEGLSRHTSVHAAGVVISNGPMENFVPVYQIDGQLITQYEMKNAEKVGLVKFDFLGLKTLTVIKKAVDFVRERLDPSFNIDTINLEDRRVYSDISSGNTSAIFQLESTGMQKLNMKLKPSCFEDIIAVLALFRPGPLQSGMVDDFIERKHGRQEIQYLVPQLEEILADTYGSILYQEQVQKIAASLASYSLGEADLLRRAMGKKKPEEMAKQKSRFLDGCVKNNIDEAIADELFELMAKFAAYGFNKSHSAAYGLVTYQTAYLKTHFPEQFMAAIMTCDMDNTDKITRYIAECLRLRFKVLQPCINSSVLEFYSPEKGVITFALSGIKGVGEGSIKAFIDERNANGPFKNFTDLANRIDLHKVGKKTLELLNEAGALDTFGANRSQVLAGIPAMVKYSQSIHEAKNSGQGMLFELQETEDQAEDVEISDWEAELLKKVTNHNPIDWLLKEKKALGVFISSHPCSLFKEDLARFGRFKLKDVDKSIGKKNQAAICFLSGLNERTTKSGNRMLSLFLEDESSSVEAVMFQKEIPLVLPKVGTMVLCHLNIAKSFDGESISIRAEKIESLELVRSQVVKGLNIALDSLDQSLDHHKALIKKLYETCTKSPGNTPIRIILRTKKSKIYLRPQNQNINLSDEFIQSIKNLAPERIKIAFA